MKRNSTVTGQHRVSLIFSNFGSPAPLDIISSVRFCLPWGRPCPHTPMTLLSVHRAGSKKCTSQHSGEQGREAPMFSGPSIHRYCSWKSFQTGPKACVNHGFGEPSIHRYCSWTSFQTGPKTRENHCFRDPSIHKYCSWTWFEAGHKTCPSRIFREFLANYQ